MDILTNSPPIEVQAENQPKELMRYEYRDKQGVVIQAKVELERCGKYRRLTSFELKNQDGITLNVFDFLKIGDEAFISVGTENTRARVIPRADISSDDIPINVSNVVFVAEPNDPAQFAIFLHEIGHTKQSGDTELSDLWSRRFVDVTGWEPGRGYPGDLRHGLRFILDEIDASRIDALDRSLIESLLTKAEAFYETTLQIHELMVSIGLARKDSNYLLKKSKLLTGQDKDECLEQSKRLDDQSKCLEKEIDNLYDKMDEIIESFNSEIEPFYKEIVDYASQPERWLERDANARAFSWLRELKRKGFDLLGDIEISKGTEQMIHAMQGELEGGDVELHCLGKPDTARGFLRHALATYGATSHQIRKGKRPIKSKKSV